MERAANLADVQSLQVRWLERPEEFERAAELLAEIWGMEDLRDTIPGHFMRAIADNGGVVLGAFDSEGRMVGILVGILAMDRETGKIYHYSHMLGVVKDLRYSGLGYKMKLAQREELLKRGIDLVMWTFDPLRGPNAKLNFSKLGAICRRYYENYYGELRDELNVGEVTDRFKVEWWIESERVARRLAGEFPTPPLAVLMEHARMITETEEIEKGVRRLVGYDLNAREDFLLVEIPGDYDLVRREAPGAAREWRMGTREIFETYFGRGYLAVDFATSGSGRERRNFYLLWKADLEEVLKSRYPFG